MIPGKKKYAPKANRFKKLAWLAKTAWRRWRAWKRSLSPELRELDSFRRCRRLLKLSDYYPRASPLLAELLKSYLETGQDVRALEEVMRKLRDLSEQKQPVPDLVFYDQPALWYSSIEESWLGRVERIIQERSLPTIHRAHIRNGLRLSDKDTVMVCAELERRGVLGPFDLETGRHRVLMTATL